MKYILSYTPIIPLTFELDVENPEAARSMLTQIWQDLTGSLDLLDGMAFVQAKDSQEDDPLTPFEIDGVEVDLMTAVGLLATLLKNAIERQQAPAPLIH